MNDPSQIPRSRVALLVSSVPPWTRRRAAIPADAGLDYRCRETGLPWVLHPGAGWLPDLTHPAAYGLLLSELRTLIGDQYVFVMFGSMQAAWVACSRGRFENVESYTSDVEALVEASIAWNREMRIRADPP